ncbi:MAG: hypothetical protein HY427_03660 [Candidatus Levybacteria bacterium]|nr:hypothetical protein [Candidatus Levybacteria bacterium]
MEESSGAVGENDRTERTGFNREPGRKNYGGKQIARVKQIALDDWQEEIVNYDGHILLCTGRQVGKTTVMAVKAAEYMIKNPGHQIIVVSLTEDQAQIMIIKVLDYLEKNFRLWIAKGKNKPTKNKIVLTNKASILARPVGNTGDAVRGFTGNVLIVDEASRMPDDMWSAAKPALLTTGGKLWFCSTPHGKQGYFYECWLNKSGRFKVFHINSEECLEKRPIGDIWTEEKRNEALRFLSDEKNGGMSKLRYGQEYLGLFLDDLRQMFDDALIKKCMNAQRPGMIDKTKDYYLGIDVARMGDDESTFEILRREDKNLIHVENIVTTKTLLSDTTKMILQLDRVWNFKKIYIDDGGLGVGVFDYLLKEEQTKRKIEAINNRARPLVRDETRKKKLLKEDLYSNLLVLMEQGRIRLLDDENIRLSLKSVQYEYQDGGKIEIFGNYTHIVEGLTRAAWCIKEKSLNLWISYI